MHKLKISLTISTNYSSIIVTVTVTISPSSKTAPIQSQLWSWTLHIVHPEWNWTSSPTKMVICYSTNCITKTKHPNVINQWHSQSRQKDYFDIMLTCKPPLHQSKTKNDHKLYPKFHYIVLPDAPCLQHHWSIEQLQYQFQHQNLEQQYKIINFYLPEC